MISFLQEHKILVVVSGLIALLIINRDYFGFLWGWTKRVRSTTPSDRRALYDNLIVMQGLLVKCGVDRDVLDAMTLSEVGVVATTGNYEKTSK